MNENLRILIINAEEKLSQSFVKELYRRDHANYLCVNINIYQREWINKYLDNWKPDVVVCVSSNVTKFVIEAVQKAGVTLICNSSDLDELIRGSLEKFYILKVESNTNFGTMICNLIDSNKFGVYRLANDELQHIE